ncbi:MAG: type II secretion system protein GspJ, partial [Pseudomonadota bacterium]
PDRVRATSSFESVLLDGLTRIDVRFYAGGRPATRWGIGLGIADLAMPDIVEMTFGFENGETLRQSFLVGGRT